ncbi:MAG TPA: thioredoxin family protein [Gemmatimonadales bacterium]|nr:thioredoxin family protein [Gemmatimonadales bacterium]
MLHATPRRLALLTASVLTLALVVAPAHAQLALGDAIPMADVKMKNVNDKDITLASQAGKKGTLVVFTCNHCPWAKLWESRVAEIGNAAVAAGLGAVAVNSNDPSVNAEDGFPEMKKRAKQLKMKFPYVVDGTSDVARAFGATRTPEAFVFDAQGKLVYHGTIDDNANDAAAVKEAWLKDAVNAVAAGKAVSVAETKAFGCTIKFRKAAASATTGS